MNTINVEPKDVMLGDKNLGTVTSVNINGNVQFNADKVNLWINLNGLSGTLSNKNMEVPCASTGVVWADVEAAVLSEFGLVKAAE